MKCLLGLALLAAACGPSASSITKPTGDRGSAVVALPDVPFEKLDHDQRAEFMKQKVVPGMKAVFQNHDAKEFAQFGCETCHGAQAKDGHFDMPNPDLPKLNLKDMSKFKAEDVAWMTHEVAPTMAKLLGVAMDSAENPTGFGCTSCHTLEAP